jgi:hypothetical protein
MAERVQRMEHPELLTLAEKISIDGTSLRTIYEAKQITEPGLRRITNEYLRGGDVKAALQQELLVKELSYERDPQSRDRLAASYTNVDEAKPRASSDGMASLLEHGARQPSNQFGSTKEVDQEASEKPAKQPAQQVLISAWVALVVVLVIIVLVLLMR